MKSTVLKKESENIWSFFDDVVEAPKKVSIEDEEIDEIDDVCENCDSNKLVLVDGSMCCRDCGMINSKHK